MSAQSTGRQSSLSGGGTGHAKRRRLMDRVMTVIAYACAALALIPLVWITVYVIYRGLGAWNVQFFTELPQLYGDGGGIRNGITGTLFIVGMASAMGIPFGVMAGIYLAEYGDNRFAAAIRFLTDTLTGVPSIVIGLFAFGIVVVNTGGFNAFAGAFALAVMMIPIIARTTEEIIRLVPDSIREASLALGVPRWKTILRVVLPTALSGVITGVILSVARVAGETAPLILTILGTNFPITLDPFGGPSTTLSLQVFQLAGQPSPEVRDVAWGAALLLIIFVLGMSIGARVLFRGNSSIR
ncbi:Phosphate ABC transporter, permease protein PstA [Rubrobacter radiotolerans]|uniref:Phosphate transport system permease protein PstA n=1 Tax=Rubrobacter radiotolerans TaxID=42256 RepID=A0A023X1A9_RUBRA|nr:phosphate ABC transporter permease PstA [Rubrobacter radiotolerans]AHY45986.1 Phosphate ABC transporter, permease protein PstA [Rubrobacter radiotolerans]MDX5893398.1 phosphate ABC transporter permease PstA [Rubrobacter radiotolerans]SMC03654.1 phosphate ABC transporter membrane protein 2, PhoT family [Rubrobacter radiotolerans DSM 5868]